MIKAKFKNKDEDVILFGLDETNIQRLTEGEGLFVNGADILTKENFYIGYTEEKATLTSGKNQINISFNAYTLYRIFRDDIIYLKKTDIGTSYDLMIVYGKTFDDIIKDYDIPVKACYMPTMN